MAARVRRKNEMERIKQAQHAEMAEWFETYDRSHTGAFEREEVSRRARAGAQRDIARLKCRYVLARPPLRR